MANRTPPHLISKGIFKKKIKEVVSWDSVTGISCRFSISLSSKQGSFHVFIINLWFLDISQWRTIPVYGTSGKYLKSIPWVEPSLVNENG